MGLMDVPGLRGILQARALNERSAQNDNALQMGQLQQVGALQGILSKQQAMQEEQQAKALVTRIAQEAGGDPAKMVPMFLQAGPLGIKLASELKGLLPPKAKPELVTVNTPNGPMQKWINPGETAGVDVGPKYEKPTTPELSGVGKLMRERDALPQGDPRRATYDQAIAAAAKNAGGGVNVSLGGINLGKEGSNKVDTGLLDTTAGLMRLSAIEGQFRPEFQQTLPRVSAEWSAWKDKLGVGMQPQDKQFLAQFSSYKRNAINSMNEYIKSITGAAMSEAEAQRILRGMPNPGQGMFDGDSPTEFKSKLDDAMKQTKLALARYEYIKRRGISLSDASGNPVVGLEKMPQIMNERGKELEIAFKQANPNIAADQLSQQVRGTLAKEFGLIR